MDSTLCPHMKEFVDAYSRGPVTVLAMESPLFYPDLDALECEECSVTATHAEWEEYANRPQVRTEPTTDGEVTANDGAVAPLQFVFIGRCACDQPVAGRVDEPCRQREVLADIEAMKADGLAVERVVGPGPSLHKCTCAVATSQEATNA